MATKRRPLERRTTPPPPLRPSINHLAPGDIAPGVRISIGDWITDQVRRGVHPVHAAAACGITTSELLSWTREGAVAVNRLAAGADWRKDFTPAEQDLAVFSDKMNRALGLAITQTTLQVSQHVRGGRTLKTVTEKRDPSNGNVVIERIERTEEQAPNLDAAKWYLERVAPNVFGAKATLQVNVADLTDTEAVKSTVESRMIEVAERLAGKSIEVDAREEDS